MSDRKRMAGTAWKSGIQCFIDPSPKHNIPLTPCPGIHIPKDSVPSPEEEGSGVRYVIPPASVR